MKTVSIVIVSLLMAICGGPFVAADPPSTASPLRAPTAEDRQALETVAAMLPKYHISRHALDKEVARAWLNSFLRLLDPDKLYFLKADVDRLVSQTDQLADRARSGDVQWAFDTFQVLLQRVDARARIVPELLVLPVDFTLDETIAVDFGAARYASNEAEAREGLRKRLKLELLDLKLKGASVAEARERVARRFRSRQKQMHRWNADRLMGVFVRALALAYDSQCSYLSPAEIDENIVNTTQALEGIGVQVTLIDGEPTILRLIPGGSAAKDGRLRPGDWITGVGQGQNGEILDLEGADVNDVVHQTRGKAGTVCRVRITRKGDLEPRVFALERGKAQLQEVRRAVVERGKKDNGQPLRIGYLRVPSLYQGASRAGMAKSASNDVRAALTDPVHGFVTAGVDLVVLDLRNNIGGVFSEVANLASLFLGSGPMLQLKGATPQVRRIKGDALFSAWDGPLLVLTNRKTASGAELVAAALQDYGRALVVGDQSTAGAGTAQIGLGVGREASADATPAKLGMLSVTNVQMYRVNGDSTQTRGFIPDVVIPTDAADFQPVRETFSVAEPSYDQIAAVEHANLARLVAEQKAELQTKSDRRREKSAAFRALLEKFEQSHVAKTRKSASLNEQRAIQEGRTASENGSAENVDGPLFQPDAVTDEVVTIAADYLSMLKTAR